MPKKVLLGRLVARGASQLIATKFAETNEEILDNSDDFVTNANPQRLMNRGAHDGLEFEVREEGEERVGVEGRNWMWNPLKKLETGGFDFVVRTGRKKMEFYPRYFGVVPSDLRRRDHSWTSEVAKYSWRSLGIFQPWPK